VVANLHRSVYLLPRKALLLLVQVGHHQVALRREHIIKVVGEERDADHHTDVAAPAQLRLLCEVLVAEDEGGGENQTVDVSPQIYVATLGYN